MNTLDPQVYMIRRISDGLFSLGGLVPEFDSTGKIWRTEKSLVLHLKKANYRDPCHVVRFWLKYDMQKKLRIYVNERVQSMVPIVHFRRSGHSQAACKLESPEAVSNRRARVTCSNCMKTKVFQGKRA